METNLEDWYHLSDPRERGFIRDVDTMDELASLLRTKVPSVEKRVYLGDAWGRPYKLDIRAEGPKTVIRITSSGANGVFEGGQGDDLYVEIAFDSEKIEETGLKQR